MTARLPSCSSREILRVVVRLGGHHVRTKGSHAFYVREAEDGQRFHTVIPLDRKDIPRGTLTRILREFGISREEFLRELT